ncbi:MAG: hypothetical protein ABR511_14775 [Acidimicrobiales bacterium]
MIADTPGGVAVALQWREPGADGCRELFQVLRLRDGRVVDIQDVARRGAALALVGAPG